MITFREYLKEEKQSPEFKKAIAQNTKDRQKLWDKFSEENDSLRFEYMPTLEKLKASGKKDEVKKLYGEYKAKRKKLNDKHDKEMKEFELKQHNMLDKLYNT